jgi:hypothetical protein
MDLLEILTIPMGVLVAILTQITKIANPPAWAVQLTVLVLALGLAFLARYGGDWYTIAVEAISTAGVAFLTYETFIKKI